MRPDPVRESGLRAFGAHDRLRQVAFGEDGAPRPFEERVRLLEAYKIEIKKEYRRRARELHPDMNPGMPVLERRECEARFAELTAAYDYLMKLEAKPPAPPRIKPESVRDVAHMAQTFEDLAAIMRQREMRVRAMHRWENGERSTRKGANGFPW